MSLFGVISVVICLFFFQLYVFIIFTISFDFLKIKTLDLIRIHNTGLKLIQLTKQQQY